jgi:hypothetical protein
MALPLSRRAVLRGAGGAAVSLPLLEAMLGRSAGAQEAGGPRRFIFIYCGIPWVGEDSPDKTGKIPQFMLPDAPGALNGPFKLALEPLETAGLRPDTTVVSSMRIPRTGANNGRRFGSSGFHYETMGPLVSGVSVINKTFPSFALGPSCDWLLAEKIGMASRFPSLVYCVQSAEHTNGYSMDRISYKPRTNIRNPMWDPPTLRNDPVVSPRVAFDQLFSGFVPPTMGQVPPAPDPAVLKRKDILSRVLASYTRLQPRLGVGDRQRLDQHMDSVRDLERRVNAAPLPATPAPGACRAPTRPDADPGASSGYANEDQRAASIVDLIHMAIACDLTRVVSLQLTSSMSGIVLPTSLGITYRSWDGSSLSPPPLHEATHGQGDNLTVAECIRWHMKHVAALAKKLKDTPDTAGNMLDNTAIVFAMEAGMGNTRLSGGSIVGERPPHTSEGMAALVIGGKRLGMQLGNHIVAPDQHPASVILSAMRAAGGAQMTALGEITTEIPGLRMG